MQGQILDVLNASSFFLLIVNAGDRIVEQPIEPRYMRDLLEAEGLSEPADLVGKCVTLSDDGMTLGLE